MALGLLPVDEVHASSLNLAIDEGTSKTSPATVVNTEIKQNHNKLQT